MTLYKLDMATGQRSPLTAEEEAEHLELADSLEQDRLARAWAALREIRDDFLDRCQLFFDRADGAAPNRQLPAALTDAIDANADAWLAWRDAMRNLPETVLATGADPADLVATAPNSTADDPWPELWPQPPLEPVKYRP